MEPDTTMPADGDVRGAVGRFGMWAAVSTTVLTVVSFALALTALPDKVPYPFTDPLVRAQWPGDYLWMFPAMALMLCFVALVAAVHLQAPRTRRAWSLTALSVAVVATTVLLVDYAIQVTVMQPSLEKQQLDGWALFTQYNPNGVFIALEELGYSLMSLVFLGLAPLFPGTGLKRAIRWLLASGFAATALALTLVSASRGIDRGDTFEIAVITIVWVTLIAVGPLLAVAFRRTAS